MTRLSVCLLIFLWVTGCTSPPRQPAATGPTAAVDGFVTSHFAARPAVAAALGWHSYDGRFWLPNQTHLEAEAARLRHFDDQFAAMNGKSISAEDERTVRLVRTIIAGERLQLERIRAPYRNPMFYAQALDVSLYLKRDWKPLVDRVRDMTELLRQAPVLFQTARSQLETVLPRPWVETAIQIAEDSAGFIEGDVVTAGRDCGNPAVSAAFVTAAQSAAREHRKFATWLKSQRLPASTPDFAIGRERYAQLLATELIDLKPEEILEIGLKELRAEEARFNAAAADIDSSRPAVEVFKSIQHDHPTANQLISETRRTLEAIRQFVVDHQIITIPSEVRAKVTETLPPFRATSFASMDTPGPFETGASQAYYYVTPVESNWSPSQQEEWLTAFNFYTTDVVSIHEAYPGHYVQFLALNASGASTARKVFASYAFTEGWAHYCEQMLLAEGFGQPADPAHASSADKIRAAKYRLAQSDEALLRVCRLCVSVQMHCLGMTLDQGTRFFVDHCHYEEKTARQEAIRGTFDPGYCFYTLGKLQFLKLREDWKRQEGPAFSLQRFHDEALRHGAPPLRLLRETMLKDSRIHGELF